ncbi:hypothetical protein KMP13_16110 [Epibacterium ulvae]|uniref:CAP domain-containing protein n=1 Tax=Epibacterium ulvae TaxID=1156985 RepID=UPI001BFC6370|nr:CAP domain-containing protein [Epibacterium ulvae]MBT8155365.1 hypothetical protein [Epibacterium ulvae]
MSEASAFERQMLELINAERAANGLDPVQLELRLNESAEDHSTWMLDEDVFSHTGENGSSAGERMSDAGFEFTGSWRWSENIAWQSERGDPGLEDDVIDLHNALMNSPGHRANILDPNVTVIGIGIELGEFDGYTAVMVTQNFARTSADLQLDDGIASVPDSTEPDPVEPAPTEPEAAQPTAGNDVITLETPGAIDLLGGHDTGTGTTGNDTIRGGNGRDELIGNAGADSLFGGRHADDLYGGDGRDRLFGGAGHDELFGDGDRDVLRGNNGRDTLDGGAGNDVLVGGNAEDTFVFSAGVDRINDFSAGGVDDIVDLTNANGIDSFEDLVANHTRQLKNGNLRITDADGDRLVIKNTDLSDLEASDFLF